MIKVIPLLKTPYLSLWKTRTESGRDWVFASRKVLPECVNPDSRPDAVQIFCLHKDGDRSGIVVTHEFRPPINAVEWAFPAGLIDHDETVEQAAIREFKEETGLDLFVRFCSPKLYSSAGMTDESVVTVFGTSSGNVSNQFQEPSENITVEILSLEEAAELLRGENRFHGARISAKLWPYLYMFVTDSEKIMDRGA